MNEPDANIGETLFQTLASFTGGCGSFPFDDCGAWIYILANSNDAYNAFTETSAEGSFSQMIEKTKRRTTRKTLRVDSLFQALSGRKRLDLRPGGKDGLYSDNDYRTNSI